MMMMMMMTLLLLTMVVLMDEARVSQQQVSVGMHTLTNTDWYCVLDGIDDHSYLFYS